MPRKLDFGTDEDTIEAPERAPLPIKATPREPINPALANAAASSARAAGFVPRESAVVAGREGEVNTVPCEPPPRTEVGLGGLSVARTDACQPSERQFVDAPTMHSIVATPPVSPVATTSGSTEVRPPSEPSRSPLPRTPTEVPPAFTTGCASEAQYSPGALAHLPNSRTRGAGIAPTISDRVKLPTHETGSDASVGNDAHTMRRRPGRPRREPQTRVSLAGPVRVIERFQAFCLAHGDVTYWQGIEMLLDEIEG